MKFYQALRAVSKYDNVRWIERREIPGEHITVENEADGEKHFKSSRTGKRWHPSDFDILQAEDWEVIRG